MVIFSIQSSIPLICSLALILSIPVLHISIGIYASASSDPYAQVSNLDHTGVCAIVIG
jgi:hypothetical protein